MKNIKLFIIAASMIVFISCSSNSEPLLDDKLTEDPAFGDQFKNDNTNRNDSTGGVNETEIVDWNEGVIVDITITPD